MDSRPGTRSTAFRYNFSSQQPIFNVSEAPFHRTSFTNNFTTRDPSSFPTFLKTKESDQDQLPSQILKCVEDDTELNVFDAEKYFSENNTNPRDSKGPSQTNAKHASEITGDAVWRVSSASSSVEGLNRNFRVRSFNATPTASSEASWNSQTGLLSNPPGSIPISLRNIPAGNQRRGSSSTAKWFFCRKCPCSGKKSLEVDDGSPDHRTQGESEDNDHNNKANLYQKRHGQSTQENEKMSPRSPGSTAHKLSAETHYQRLTSLPRLPTQNHFSTHAVLQQRVLASGRTFNDSMGAFSFPILNPSYQPKPNQKGIFSAAKTQTASTQDDPPRESLEVFQPSEQSILRKSLDEQRVVLGPKTHGRGNFAFHGSPSNRAMSAEDDVASDASSDLFEIESFSTQTTSTLYRRGDSLDEAATFNARRLATAAGGNGIGNFYCSRSLDEPMTPTTENYAPSEASIEWSVTTAEGYDKASMTNFSISASEVEEFASLRRGSLEMVGGGGSRDDYRYPGCKKKGNGLLLSCRHESAVCVGPNPVKCVPVDGPPLPLISSSGHVNTAASRPPKPNAPPLAKGHSAHLSLAFAA